MILTEADVFKLLQHPDKFDCNQAFHRFSDGLTACTDILPILLKTVRDKTWKYWFMYALSFLNQNLRVVSAWDNP